MGSHEPDELLIGFASALREAGLRVTPDRTRTFLEAVALVGLGDERATYWAGEAALCASPQDLELYDRVFTAWFHNEPSGRRTTNRPRAAVVQASLPEGGDEGAGSGEDEEAEAIRAMASATEVLRHKDIAELSAEERARLARMFGGLRPRLPESVAYRHVAWRRGAVDRRTTLRRMRSAFGEPVDLARQHRSTRRRRVVLLVDVSGSMSAYSDALLRLAHRVASAGPGQVEVFTLGTRLTRVTRALRQRDADRALIAAGDAVVDWSGGTRLGETLKAFLDRWGQRGMARGAVVVIFSDGWERGDAAELATQMQRLARLAHRVVWVNPHKGSVGYQPVQQGMAAALPHLDHFVAGHSVAAFEELLKVVADA